MWRSTSRTARNVAYLRSHWPDLPGDDIEFVADTLRNNLLGLPLDLAALNIARGRDTG